MEYQILFPEAHQLYFGAVFTTDRLMLHSTLDFPENEGGSRKLKKVLELVQHVSEQYRHDVSKQNKTYKN